MKKRSKILLAVLLFIYPSYKGSRELLWVRHSNYTIDSILNIKLRIDDGLVGFQDFENDKTITILNTKTGAKMKASYVSLESELYFYIDTVIGDKVLTVVDKFAGSNSYNYSTLKLIGIENCFVNFGGCGGFNDSSFAALGKPYLTYDRDGFHQ